MEAPARLAGRGAAGCTMTAHAALSPRGLEAGFRPPAAGDAAFDEYVSDPAKPVPFRARPIQPMGYDTAQTWSRWLVDDQREASGRPDVLAFVSDVLDRAGEDRRRAGRQPRRLHERQRLRLGRQADRRLSRRGRRRRGDGRLSAHGRRRTSSAAGTARASRPRRPIAPDKPLLYRFALPTANHVFLPGHRIMVQVQSSWFPLYDRNPQTFVPEHLLGQARRLREGEPANLPRARTRKFHRVADRVRTAMSNASATFAGPLP